MKPVAWLFPFVCAVLAPLAAQARPVTVATHYFYWYAWPGEHFAEPGAPGPEGHCRHFPSPQQVDYRSVDWHAENFAQMAAAGIDAALPVYWGCPGAYERPNVAFARRGLAPMVAALDRLAAQGTAAPKLGLFYDTSTLANDVCGRAPRGGLTDLTVDEGRARFCDTVTDYFAAIPDKYWARHHGGALVVLYVSGFASAWDHDLGAVLRERFARRFPGETVCLVADASWGEIGQDLTTRWGAALWGPSTFAGVVQLGAGYDDRAVPGRRTPVREREDGNFYAWSWLQALRRHPELVLLETWNEMHEGTELCPTREAGRQYLDATARWITELRAGKAGGDAVALRWPEPRPQPDFGWGTAAAGRDEVHVDFATGEREGLREVACEDGPYRVEQGTLRAGPVASGLGNYLYFQVADAFAFDLAAGVTFELEVRRRADDRVGLEFDGNDRNTTLQGAYQPAAPPASRVDGEWLVETWRLDSARFANRQNGGADLRFVLPQRRAALLRLTLRRRVVR